MHAAHRTTDERGPAPDPEPLAERAVGAGLVTDRDVREVGAPFGAAGRECCRSSAALAAAEHIGTDDKPAFGIDGQAGADNRLPPAIALRLDPGSSGDM